MGGGFVVGVFGVLVLAHAAYSTVQHRSLLKITEEEFSGPPLKVVIELLLGLMFCMLAALTVPGKFLSIHPDSDDNRYKGSIYLLVIVFEKIYGRTAQLRSVSLLIVSLPVNPDFIIFNHRGKACTTIHTDLKLKC